MNAIDFRKSEQVALMRILERKTANIAWSRYEYRNGLFSGRDAHLLWCMIATFSPQRIIEVGSGWTTKAISDVVEFYNLPTQTTTIDTDQCRLSGCERVSVINKTIQEVDLDLFRSLNQNDMLLIDGDHNGTADGGAAFVINEILPVLKTGVIVGWHDIYLGWKIKTPNEDGGEQAILRAFLSYNACWRVLLWLPMLVRSFPGFMLPEKDSGDYKGSMMWLRKDA